MSTSPHIAIVGGGPAGLRAAEVAAEGGASVEVFEAKRSVGRKLLVAGYGGLNLTHGEDMTAFARRYSGPDLEAGWFADWLEAFGPSALREWAAGLGIETFEQRTGRVYPKEMKAAPLLRRWIERLRSQGVSFHVNHGLTGIGSDGGLTLSLGEAGTRSFDAVVLGLGGASWAKTGSDGRWMNLLEAHGVATTPFQPANCGWESHWPEALVPELEGQPLKNIAASAGRRRVTGELMLTRYGMEGGAIYQLGPELRAMEKPVITVDLKPQVESPALQRKMESVRRDFLTAAKQRLKLTGPMGSLIEHYGGPMDSIEALVRAVKHLEIPLRGPRPIDEAISSAGGVAWREIDEQLMLRKLPGIFVAGEMIDWEAPTGGYLVQGCFATGTHAGRSALAYGAMA